LGVGIVVGTGFVGDEVGPPVVGALVGCCKVRAWLEKPFEQVQQAQDASKTTAEVDLTFVGILVGPLLGLFEEADVGGGVTGAFVGG
jgi:hypothetical protein